MKMKIRTLMMASSVLAVLAGGCLAAAGEVTDKTRKEETMEVMIPNPFITRGSLGEAEAAAGFAFAVPDTYGNSTVRLIQTSSAGMIQVFYGDGETNNLLIRKAAGEKDISGDHNEYAKTEETEMAGIPVTVKSDAAGVHVMTWRAGGYSYAVLCREGMAAETAAALAGAVH